MTRIKRVLLVEDNAADANLVREVFRRLGISCQIDHYSTLGDGVRAVQQGGSAESNIPDLILVDHNLPGGDGLDVLAAVAANPQLCDVPRAILSSFVLPDEVSRAHKLGTHCVIAKPTGLADFMQEVGSGISRLLASHRATRVNRLEQ